MPRKSVLETHVEWLNNSVYKPNFDLTELLKGWEKPKSNQIKKLYETLTQKSLAFTNEQEDNEEMSPLNVYNTFIESETIKKTTTPKKNSSSKKVVFVPQDDLELELCKKCVLETLGEIGGDDDNDSWTFRSGTKLLTIKKDEDDNLEYYGTKETKEFEKHFKCKCNKKQTKKKQMKKKEVTDSDVVMSYSESEEANKASSSSAKASEVSDTETLKISSSSETEEPKTSEKQKSVKSVKGKKEENIIKKFNMSTFYESEEEN